MRPTACAEMAFSPTFKSVASIGMKVINPIACMRCIIISLRKPDLKS
jgi:hypothetical protein